MPSFLTSSDKFKKDNVKLVLAAGFEPATSSFGGKHSIQLSYASVCGSCQLSAVRCQLVRPIAEATIIT